MLQYLKEFIDYSEENALPIESILLSNKDGVIYRHDFSKFKNHSPYRNIYSHTKTFTSTCIGILLYKNKISLNDSIGKYLDKYMPIERKEELSKITIQNLLNMASGFGESLLMGDIRRTKYKDYIKEIFSHELKYEPGSFFTYSNGDTYLLGRIIEEITGTSLADFCNENIFKPLNINTPIWETDLLGHTFGASGMFLSIEDMNKLGILYLNNGVINGKRIVSEEWINKIREKQVCTNGDINKPMWLYYSYQAWIDYPYNGFRADGAFGQHTHIFIDDGYALSFTCPEDGNFDSVFTKINELIFEKFFNKK